MANPLFNTLGGNAPAMNDGGFSQMMAQLNSFRSSFRGDPKAEVQRLLNSGQMTQEEYNQLTQTAQQISRMFGK
jgi:hypothetical protein